MAAPVTHILFALLASPLLPPSFDRGEFIVGTSFPDIRYLAGLSREETHYEPISWQSVLNSPTAFQSGMTFHNLLDILRIQHVEIPFYQDRPEKFHKKHVNILKLAEDILMYHMLPNTEWKEIIKSFDTQHSEAIKRARCPQKIEQWHTALSKYFAQAPCLESYRQFFADTGGGLFLSDPTEEQERDLTELLHDDVLKKRVVHFYNSFLTLLSDQQITTPEWAYR